MWELLKSIVRILDPREPFLPWIAALAQLIIWPIRVVGYKKRISNLQQDLQDLKDEVGAEKDLTNGWFVQHKLILYILKDKDLEAFKSYLEQFGGEEAFKDVWTLPEIPKIETKKEEEK